MRNYISANLVCTMLLRRREPRRMSRPRKKSSQLLDGRLLQCMRQVLTQLRHRRQDFAAMHSTLSYNHNDVLGYGVGSGEVGLCGPSASARQGTLPRLI